MTSRHTRASKKRRDRSHAAFVPRLPPPTVLILSYFDVSGLQNPSEKEAILIEKRRKRNCNCKTKFLLPDRPLSSHYLPEAVLFRKPCHLNACEIRGALPQNLKCLQKTKLFLTPYHSHNFRLHKVDWELETLPMEHCNLESHPRWRPDCAHGV